MLAIAFYEKIEQNDINIVEKIWECSKYFAFLSEWKDCVWKKKEYQDLTTGAIIDTLIRLTMPILGTSSIDDVT